MLQKGAEALISFMKDVYPELKRESDLIGSLIEAEEKQFSDSLAFGRKIFIKKLKDLPQKDKALPPFLVWDLYSTYGFPFDLTRLMAEERGYQVNLQEVEKIKQQEKEKEPLTDKLLAQKDERNLNHIKEHVRKLAVQYHSQTNAFHPTEFTGYKNREEEGEILSLWPFKMETNLPAPVPSLKKGQSGFVITDKTCFYPEGGGPLGDRGTIVEIALKKIAKEEKIASDDKKKTYLAEIKDCQKVSGIIFHEVEVLSRKLEIGQRVHLSVDKEYRQLIATSHSGTHLLNHALRKVLGPSTRQSGSLVEPGRLRFDFTSPAPMTFQQIDKVEDIVGRMIEEARGVTPQEMPYEEALKEGAVCLQGENYDKKVRVITMGDSKELCGGIHVSNTKDIKSFKIVLETGVQSGVRRIMAYTGTRAKQWEKLLTDQIKELHEYLTEFHSSNKTEIEKNSATKLPVNNEQTQESSLSKINPFIELIKQKDEQIKFFEKQLQSLKPLGSDSSLRRKNVFISSTLTNKLLILSRQNLELRRYLKIPPPKETEEDNPFLKIFQKKQSQLDSLKNKCQTFLTPSIDKDVLIQKAKAFKDKSLLLVVELPFEDRKLLAAFADQLKDKLGSGIVVAMGEGSSQFPLIVTVTKDLQESFPAGDILRKFVAPFLKGKGGGQSRFAQGVATDKKDFSKLESHLLKELKNFIA